MRSRRCAPIARRHRRCRQATRVSGDQGCRYGQKQNQTNKQCTCGSILVNDFIVFIRNSHCHSQSRSRRMRKRSLQSRRHRHARHSSTGRQPKSMIMRTSSSQHTTRNAHARSAAADVGSSMSVATLRLRTTRCTSASGCSSNDTRRRELRCAADERQRRRRVFVRSAKCERIDAILIDVATHERNDDDASSARTFARSEQQQISRRSRLSR